MECCGTRNVAVSIETLSSRVRVGVGQNLAKDTVSMQSTYLTPRITRTVAVHYVCVMCHLFCYYHCEYMCFDGSSPLRRHNVFASTDTKLDFTQTPIHLFLCTNNSTHM